MFLRFYRMIFCILIAISLFLAASHNADAGWNPIKDIERGLGSAARGVGGIFGQGLAGFAGPTVTDTANAIQRVADETIKRAEASANKVISNANVAAAERIKQVADLVSLNIEDVDKRIREHITKLDETITLKMGTADIIATRQIYNIETALMNAARYTSIVILITVALAILFYFAVRRWQPTLSVEKFGPSLAYGIILLGAFSGIAAISSSLFKPPSDAKFNQIGERLIESYRDSLQTGNFDSAVYFASQYSSFDAMSLAPRFLLQFADLQRDLLRRGALFSLDSGRRELFARVAQTSRTWDAVSADVPKPLAFLKYEVPATTSMIAWQSSRTVADQIKAGCIAAGALHEYSIQVPKPNEQLQLASGYIWLAASYVNWLTETDPNWALVEVANLCEQAVKGSSFNKGWLMPATTVAQNFTRQPDAAPPGIAAVFSYNVHSAAFYRDIAREYSNAVVGDTQLRAYKTQEQINIAKTSRDASLAAIMKRWEEYSRLIGDIPDLSGKDVVLSITGLPLGIVARAQSMKTSERPAAAAATPTVIPSAPEREALTTSEKCSALFARVKYLFVGATFDAVCVNQQAVDAKLREFEQDLQLAFQGDSQIRQMLRSLADKYDTDAKDMLSLVASISGCIEFSDRSVWKACGSQGQKLVRFIDWLKDPDRAAKPSLQGGAERVAIAR